MNFAKKPLLTPIAAAILGVACTAGAHAGTVDGTIYQRTAADPTGKGTTVDYWSFTLTQAANVEIDVLSNEGYTNGWGAHPGAYVDLNGDGEITLSDTQFRVFADHVALDTEVIDADDSPSYAPPGTSNGWGDGSLLMRDSYLNTALDVGTYVIAFGDYSMTLAEAVDGFNVGDAIAGATGLNPFTGANGQDHFDYRLTFNFTDFETGAAMNVRVAPPSAVPVPGAIWLLGSALSGMGVLRRRRAV